MSNFKHCFDEYEDRSYGIRAAKLQKEALEEVDRDAIQDNDNELSDTELYRVPTSLINTQTEWSKWIKQPVAPRDTNILQFWKAKQYEFPIVAEIARAHLAIPATSALSECVFSNGSDIVTKKRNRLSGETVRYIMCLKG
jgi:hypothetical protein